MKVRFQLEFESEFNEGKLPAEALKSLNSMSLEVLTHVAKESCYAMMESELLPMANAGGSWAKISVVR